jgi:hypothetical protein
MSAITSSRTSAVASVAEAYPALDLGDIASAKDLVKAFNNFKLDGGDVKKVKKAPQALHTPQPASVVASAPTRISIDVNNIDIDVKKLVDDLSAMEISKPARRLAQRQAPKAHPYRRPTLTKSEKILSSHGMAKKGTVCSLFPLCIHQLMPFLFSRSCQIGFPLVASNQSQANLASN